MESNAHYIIVLRFRVTYWFYSGCWKQQADILALLPNSDNGRKNTGKFAGMNMLQKMLNSAT